MKKIIEQVKFAALGAAGLRVEPEQVTELTGLRVSEAPAAAPAAPMAFNSLRVRYAPTMLYPPARAVFETACNAAAGRAEAATAEPPLTDGELAAVQRWSGGIPADALHADFETAYGELAKAVLPMLPVKRRRAATAANECTVDHDPERCRCDGTTPSAKSPKNWTPITAPPTITPEEGKARLLKGETATDPRGETVTLDATLLNHWYATDEESKRKGKEPQSENEINARCAELPLMLEVIKNPHEIWRNENGSITYLAKFLDRYKPHGEGYMVAFTKAGNDALLETYKPNTHLSAGRRKGELLWEREEKSR